MMNQYKYFILHDPVGNIESQVTDFDPKNLQEAADAGMVFIGVDVNNVRHRVSVEEVKPVRVIEERGGGSAIPIVLPSYVDSKIDEVMSVIQDLTDVMWRKDLISTPNLDKIQNSINTLREKAQKAIADEKETLSKLQTTTNVKETKVVDI